MEFVYQLIIQCVKQWKYPSGIHVSFRNKSEGFSVRRCQQYRPFLSVKEFRRLRCSGTQKLSTGEMVRRSVLSLLQM
jgi:hypothetical protein